MSPMVRRLSGSAGFSLTEALVALAIAAMMAAILTRFVAGTRANAARVAERAEMTVLAETLLARVASSHNVTPGRTSGQSTGFAWRIDITPAPFTAQVLSMSEKPAPGSAGAWEPANGQADAKAGSMAALASAPLPRAGIHWVSYRVAVAIEAPSGQSYVIDTIRMGPGGVETR
jgi:prepilin-type N-terminal cleavage/methylation domain-containing protein